MIAPTCENHPTSKVLRASVACSSRTVWVCLVCGANLGDAGPRYEPTTETQYIPEVTGDEL